MTIREQVQDASFLAQHGRYIGALTTLMLAIAASSRRTFPQGIKSRKDPKKKMDDSEAFQLFLGGRIRKILFGDFGGPDEGTSSISVGFRGKEHDIAFIFYKYYRCELVHDGELPEDVEFLAARESAPGLTVGNRDIKVSISTGDKLTLDHGWIDLLVNAVTNARCNGVEFGIQHFDLIPLAGTDDSEILNLLVAKYGTSPGRVQILKHAVRRISPASILGESSGTVTEKFQKLVEMQEINGGAITGLSSHAFTDRQGNLQQRGLDFLREIAAGYELVAAT